MKFLIITLALCLVSGSINTGQVTAACNDNPSTPNNGWCIPDGWGGQRCTTWPGSCNCTCDQPVIMT